MRKAIALGAALIAALALAGCSGSTGSTTADGVPGAGGTSVEGSMGMEGDAAVGAPELSAKDAAVPTATSPVADRQIVRTGYVSMRVEDVFASTSAVHSLVAKRQGLISSEDAQSNGDSSYATITAQIPAKDLDAFIADVSKLGTVDSISVTAQDVTSQTVDLGARIDALNTSIDRLSTLLAQASRMEDLLAIETQLSQRQSELDALTAQQSYLADQVALSTVTVSLAPITEVAEIDAPGFLSGLTSGWNAFLSALMVAFTALGFLLPFMIVFVLIAVPVTFVIVRQTRRHRTSPSVDQS